MAVTCGEKRANDKEREGNVSGEGKRNGVKDQRARETERAEMRIVVQVNRRVLENNERKGMESKATRQKE